MKKWYNVICPNILLDRQNHWFQVILPGNSNYAESNDGLICPFKEVLFHAGSRSRVCGIFVKDTASYVEGL